MTNKSNLLHNLTSVLGEQNFTDQIKSKSELDGEFIFNPFLNYLIETTQIHNGRISQDEEVKVNITDYNYFKLTSILFRDLSSELKNNNSFLEETISRIFSSSYGTFLSRFNELMIAGYCKSVGLSVQFNSSEEQGLSDIIIKSDKFGSFAVDGKIVPNQRYLIEHKLNILKEQFVKCFIDFSKQNIWLTLRSLDITKIKIDLAQIRNNEAEKYESENISVIFNASPIQNADQVIVINKCRIFLQLNYDYGSVLDEIKLKIEKAIKQAKTTGHKAIPWFLVPLDAERRGIEINVIRLSGEMFPYYMSKIKEVYIIPFYSISFQKNTVIPIFDVYQIGSNVLNINSNTFNKYILKSLQEPEFWVSI